MTSDMKVLIIGAGVSGLAFAQLLRKQGIAFEIFERDDGTRKQGWALGLDECLADLKRMLPDDIDPITNASTNYAAKRPDSYAIVHGGTHEVLGVIAPQDGGMDFMSADRLALRRVLSKHLNVQYGKQLKSFEQGEHGVTVRFADGSTAEGTLLVGADGANSAVRGQLIPGFKAALSRYVMVSANVTLTAEEYKPILELANTCVIIGAPDTKSYIMLMAYNDDGTAAWHWAVAKRRDDADADDAHAQVQALGAEELFREALRLTEHFPAYYRAAVEKTGPEGMHTPPIKLTETVLPADQLPDGTVTLLGDACHSMVPFRGGGANTALRDACDLATILGEVARTGGDIRPALREYERDIIPRGRAKVLESRADGEGENFETSGGRLGRLAEGQNAA